MKKNWLLIVIVYIMIFANNVYAANYNTQVSRDMTYSQCIDFQDPKRNSNSNGYTGHCVRATCYGGVWQTDYYISENLVKCTNGNQSHYTQITNNGCTPYIGSCTPTTTVKYCSVVKYFDCSKTSNGIIFVPPTTAPPLTSTPTTKPTTKPTTRPITSRPGTTTKPTQPITTEPVIEKSNNNYLSNLIVSPGVINFSKETLNYTLEITEEVTTLYITPTLENDKATFVIENNENLNIDTPVTITVTAEDGLTRVYTINLKYKESGEILDNNSKIKNLKVSNHTINFDPNILSYTVKINKENKLELDITLESDTSLYSVVGNQNLKNKSKISINVTAEDGSETVYTINIKASSNLGNIFVIIVVLGIAGFVGYKLISKITVKEKETKYEYE